MIEPDLRATVELMLVSVTPSLSKSIDWPNEVLWVVRPTVRFVLMRGPIRPPPPPPFASRVIDDPSELLLCTALLSGTPSPSSSQSVYILESVSSQSPPARQRLALVPLTPMARRAEPPLLLST